MPRPLTFQQIAAFRAVVLSGTTVAAARMLHTTQPTISRLIGQAQSASGLELFVNDRGRLRITREGRHLFETVQVNFQGMDRIEQTIAALRTSGAGVFRVACTPSLGQGVLPATLERFARSLPRVHFNVATLGGAQIETGLRQGLYDVALTHDPLEGDAFRNTEIHRSEAVWVGNPGHALARLGTIRVADLAGETLLSLPQGDRLEAEVRRALAARRIAPAKTIETTYSSTICSFAAQGLGTAVINPYMASVFRDRLAIRRFDPRITVTVHAVLARHSPVSELSERFLIDLSAAFREGDWAADAPALPARGGRSRRAPQR